jgi:hypothetical protein
MCSILTVEDITSAVVFLTAVRQITGEVLRDVASLPLGTPVDLEVIFEVTN